MIPFRPIRLAEKDAYNKILRNCTERGCEYSFSNLFLWGRQEAAMLGGYLALFSHFNGRTVYPFPVGSGDIQPVLDALIADSRERGIPLRLTSMLAEDWQELDRLYPGRFQFHHSRASHDYVYALEELAELRGRKYQQKRNHIHRFFEACPDCTVRVLDADTLPQAWEMITAWYAHRAQEDPLSDFQMERVALSRAVRWFSELDMDGIALYSGGKPVAVTMGSFLSDTVFDVQFEKADETVPGAYAAVNQSFARYLREKYAALVYLNREDDMGLEGLRKAKLSYHPHHMVEKGWARLLEENYEY